MEATELWALLREEVDKWREACVEANKSDHYSDWDDADDAAHTIAQTVEALIERNAIPS
ncbi:hypothetical protein LZ318_11835 [Saccharopolyspora indica]|uniref:hypothetical protein n=1 Tax=Saccharopolyspora indica TaxID=1229659 RepID=UPI0022EB1FB7|nr:hypothetical protein [Saccharopolyspora indica]MDA3643798.1 hypothetical protein [Saccharopolyspora indica]